MALMLIPLPLLLITRDTSAPWMLYIFIACFGLGSGMYTPAYTSIAADLFKGRNFGTIIGTANMGYGISASFGTWLYGYIFDISGTYTLAIVIAMLSVLVMLASIWVASPRRGRLKLTGP
jgi:MFS family permease